MKTTCFTRIQSSLPSLAAFLALNATAFAHPGHYHPGEEDEFDALRANYFHLHGPLEITLALAAVAFAIIFKINKNQRIRMGAAIALGGSLLAIAAL
jgi:hypothetical protein